jgi:DNA ligase-1
MLKAELQRREFLQQAHKYNDRSKVGGWLYSEKLDGTRCLWDGGISRGLPTLDIPWANVRHPKTGQMKSKIKPTATGLWSRYGNPIAAPDWWLNQLPSMPLDGELWAGRGGFQFCRSAVAKDVPIDSEWKKIEYPVFGSPPFEALFGDGEIKDTNFKVKIYFNQIKNWFDSLEDSRLVDMRFVPFGTRFIDELDLLNQAIPSEGSIVYLHRQTQLPKDIDRAGIEALLEAVLELGGEGLVIRNPDGKWVPKRSHDVLKYKPYEDDEGVLVGFTSGRETDKGSKLLGKIGALILDYKGQRLELSGLTDQEREFQTTLMTSMAADHPGEEMPAGFNGKHFKVGQTITFKYRELSDEGIPKEARYHRPRDIE